MGNALVLFTDSNDDSDVTFDDADRRMVFEAEDGSEHMWVRSIDNTDENSEKRALFALDRRDAQRLLAYLTGWLTSPPPPAD